MAILKISEMDWKEKQYAAHHRLSKKMGWDFSDNNPYFERFYIVLPNPRIKTKAQAWRGDQREPDSLAQAETGTVWRVDYRAEGRQWCHQAGANGCAPASPT